MDMHNHARRKWGRAMLAGWLATALGAAALPALAHEPTPPGRAGSGTANAATTSFHFSNIPVRSALQLLAEQGNFNLVVSDSVQGTISLHLTDVTWEQALAVVLRLKGLEQHIEGNSRTVSSAGG